MASKNLKVNLEKLVKGEKTKLKIDCYSSLYQILKLNPDNRVPAISLSVDSNSNFNFDDGFYGGSEKKVKLYKLAKHREFYLKYFISSNKVVTELYENGIKIKLDLPSVDIPKSVLVDKLDIRSPLRSLFIYRGESENNSDKEICMVYQSFRNDVIYPYTLYLL